MTLRRAALYIGGGSLLVAWFSSAASLSLSRNNTRIDTERDQSASVIEDLGSQMEQQSKRLRAHLASAPKPQAQSRNPFAFGEVPRPVRTARPVDPVVATAGPFEPPEPVLRLVGIAEHQRETGRVRTALLVGQAEDLVMVTVGDAVQQRYKVTAISADAVELADFTSGRTRRIALEVP